MPSKPTKGTIQLSAELPAELVAAVRAFADSRGEKVRDVIGIALRRHMANPPPSPAPVQFPPLPPLPSGTASAKPTPAKKPKAKK